MPRCRVQKDPAYVLTSTRRVQKDPAYVLMDPAYVLTADPIGSSLPAAISAERQQRDRWLGKYGSSAGRSRHLSIITGQRGWKRQPAGNLAGFGTVPGITRAAV